MREDNTLHKAAAPSRYFYPLKKALRLKGIPYWKGLKAANAGIIKTYTLGNKRKMTTLEDIDAALEASCVEEVSHV